LTPGSRHKRCQMKVCLPFRAEGHGNMEAIKLSGVNFSYASGGKLDSVLSGIDLAVEAGQFLSFVGPTGCGKSTLLHLIAGLSQPSSGQLDLFGRVCAGVNTDCGYLFQSDSLLPWRTALENVTLGLEIRGVEKRSATELGMLWLDRVQLKNHHHKFPHELSGGMRKRVALAQTLITNPKILLMDEPFSALDVQTRSSMENLLLDLWSADRKTVIFVTHDIEEAISLSDRVIVLSAGPSSHPIAEFPVLLPRPRDVFEVRLAPEFLTIQREIWAKLKQEVEKTNARLM